MGKYLTLSVSFILLMCCATAQVGLSVSPMQLQFNTGKGKTQQMNILVSNPDTGSMQVAANIADWLRDSVGTIRYFKPGELLNSCSSWLKILPGTQFNLGPNETKQVTITMQVPDKIADTMANSMILFTQLNPIKAKQERGMNILLTVRVGVQVFYTPPGIHQKGIEINNFTDSVFMVKNTENDKKLLLTLRNTGNIETDGKVNFELHNLTTGEKITLPEKKFYTLPGAIYIVEASLPAGLVKGDYSATALVDYGQEYELKIGELQFKQK